MLGGGDVHASRENYLDFIREFAENRSEKYYGWKGWIASGLADTVTVVKPDFPDKFNADYDAWKIMFDACIRKYSDSESGAIIVAHSLGGIFLAKYLSENEFPMEITAIHMIAPVWNDDILGAGETVGNFAFEPENLANLEKQAGEVHFWHSEDDTIVPYHHSLRYLEYLPKSILHSFANR